LIQTRLSQPVFRRRKYFQSRSIRGGGVKDVVWLAPDGREMTDETWNAEFVKSLGVLLAGDAIEELDERGQPIVGDTLLVVLNAHDDKVPFTLPDVEDNKHQWVRILDTIEARAGERAFKGGAPYPLQGRSVAVFKVTPPLRERRRATAAKTERADQPAQEAQAEPVPAATK